MVKCVSLKFPMFRFRPGQDGLMMVVAGSGHFGLNILRMTVEANENINVDVILLVKLNSTSVCISGVVG